MEQSLARAQEKIVKLESQIEQMRTALSLIYEISQDRITPVWEVVEHIAASAKHALNRKCGIGSATLNNGAMRAVILTAGPTGLVA